MPAKHGEVRNLTGTPGVRTQQHVVARRQMGGYISDATGEGEIYITAVTAAANRQVTHGGDTYKYEIRWSPDSTKILWVTSGCGCVM